MSSDEVWVAENVPAGAISCVITRFAVRTPVHVIQSYVEYRRIRRDARKVAGFIHAAFLMDGARSIVMISLWASPASIAQFGTLSESHGTAARRMFGRLRMSAGRPAIWSTRWYLAAVSGNRLWLGQSAASSIGPESPNVQ